MNVKKELIKKNEKLKKMNGQLKTFKNKNQSLNKLNEELQTKMIQQEEQIRQKDLRVCQLQEKQLNYKKKIQQIQSQSYNLTKFTKLQKEKGKDLQDTIKAQEYLIQIQRIKVETLQNENAQLKKKIQQLQERIQQTSLKKNKKKIDSIQQKQKIQEVQNVLLKQKKEQNAQLKQKKVIEEVLSQSISKEQQNKIQEKKTKGRKAPKFNFYLAEKWMKGQKLSNQFQDIFVKAYNQYQQKDLLSCLTEHITKRLNGICLMTYQLIEKKIFKNARAIKGALFQNDKMITKIQRLKRTNNYSEFNSRAKSPFSQVHQQVKLKDISHKHSAHIYGFHLQFQTKKQDSITQNQKIIYQQIIAAFYIVIGQVVPQPAANNISFQSKIDQLQIHIINKILQSFAKQDKISGCKFELQKKIIYQVSSQFKSYISTFDEYLRKNKANKWYNKFNEILTFHKFQFKQQEILNFFPYFQYMSQKMKKILTIQQNNDL